MDGAPFEMPSARLPLVVMEGTIAGSPVNVLLDTGAAVPFVILISAELAERLALPTSTRSVAAPGAVGAEAVEFRSSRLADFRLGPIRLRDVDAGVSPALTTVGTQIGRRLDAVLTHRFVMQRRIAIDYRSRRVEFAAARPAGAPSLSFTIAPQRPLTLLNVELNGKGPFLMALDTAASSTLIAPATAIAAGLSGGERATLLGAGGAHGGV